MNRNWIGWGLAILVSGCATMDPHPGPGTAGATVSERVKQVTRGTAASHCLAEFVEDMKANGFVAQALQRHRIDGASVAPAAR